MIKIEKHETLGKNFGIEPKDEKFYAYRGWNTITNKVYGCIAKKSKVDEDPIFAKRVIERIKYKLNHKEEQ